MPYKFLRCTNPHQQHIKMVYGDLVNRWPKLICDCGHNFTEPQEEFYKVFSFEDSFVNVDPEEDTKYFPPIPIEL